VPLWGFRCWRAIVRANRRELVVALTPLVAFAGVLAMSPNLGSDSAILRAVFEPEAVTTGKLTLVAQTVYLIVDRVLVLVLPPAVLAAVRSGLLTVQKAMVERLGAGAIVVDATLLALLAIGVVVAWSSRRFRRTVGLPLGLGGAIASLILTVQGRAGLLFLAREQIPIRYTIVPAALLALAAVAIVDALETSRQRLVATAGLAIVFACAWGAYFIVPPFVDYDWPTWAGRLEEKLASHSLEPLVIPMNPSWNPLRIDARLGPIDSGIAPRDIVHALGSRGTFRLLFTSKCDGISEVDLYLGTLAPTEQGTLVFELVNGGTTLKSITIPRGDVTSTGWRAFYFEPLRPSKDVPYLIRLRAVDNDGSASLVVLGESADTETQRRRDASLRYACSPPPGALRPGERVRL